MVRSKKLLSLTTALALGLAAFLLPRPAVADEVAGLDLIISEVYYDTRVAGEPDEFVELYNKGTQPLSLDGFRLRNASRSFSLPAGLLLRPGQYLTVTRDGAAFAGTFGRPADVAGMTLQLANSRGWVGLHNPRGHQIDYVAWAQPPVWPGQAREGLALHRRSLSPSEPGNWETASPAPGAGSLPAPDCTPVVQWQSVPRPLHRWGANRFSFTFGACGLSDFTDDIVMLLMDYSDPEYPVAAWVFGSDIAYDPATGLYRQDFEPYLYGVAPGTELAMQVYINGELRGVIGTQVGP